MNKYLSMFVISKEPMITIGISTEAQSTKEAKEIAIEIFNETFPEVNYIIVQTNIQ